MNITGLLIPTYRNMLRMLLGLMAGPWGFACNQCEPTLSRLEKG